MERIKKAIEEARLARGTGDVIRPTVIEAMRRPNPDPAFIEYAQTKTVTLDDKALDRNRVLCGRTADEVTAAYRILRTQVLQQMAQHGWTSLAVTSPIRGDGKTLTAVNLAISIAREVNYTVLLADLDFHEGGVHRCLEYKPDMDLVKYLKDDESLSSALFNPGIPRLVVLPSVGPTENSSELLTSPKMQALVTELRTRYASRLIVFDLPPLLATDDAIAFLPFVDAVLLVVQDGVTREEELRRSLELIDDTPVAGFVLNRSRERVEVYS